MLLFQSAGLTLGFEFLLSLHSQPCFLQILLTLGFSGGTCCCHFLSFSLLLGLGGGGGSFLLRAYAFTFGSFLCCPKRSGINQTFDGE